LPDDSTVDSRAARLAVALERPRDDALVDLVARLLAVDASRRVTATEALTHRFVAHLADPSDEPICTDTGAPRRRRLCRGADRRAAATDPGRSRRRRRRFVHTAARDIYTQ
jgi:serine/threonine protein kinase